MVALRSKVARGEISGRIYPEVFTFSRPEPEGFEVSNQRGLTRYTSASDEVTGNLPATLDASFVASISRVEEGARAQSKAL